MSLDNLLVNKEYILGADEVGYGSLAGDVVVCGVKVPKDWNLNGLKDSKKLTALRRSDLKNKLLNDNKIISYIAERSSSYIDKIGISLALKECYIEIFKKLYCEKTLIICDGILKFDGFNVDDYTKISLVKADNTISAVMAASILAKEYRDAKMKDLDKLYPFYDFKNNVGYSSVKHKEALKKYGLSEIHRKSYNIKI